MRPSLASSFLVPFLALGLLVTILVPSSAHGQLMLQMELDKKTYILHESITAKVRIFNRAGRDIVLGNDDGLSWLNFEIRDQKGNLVGHRGGAPSGGPLIIRAGAAVERTVDLTELYAMGDYGDYGITAGVHFGEISQSFQSARKRLTVTDGRNFWETKIGVPLGESGGGSIRSYSLIIYQSLDATYLYVRVMDVSTGAAVNCYSLGRIITFHDPVMTVDGINRLHVLYMGAPSTYRHVTIGPSGELLAQEVFREGSGNRPQLILSASGIVSVRGGFMVGSGVDSEVAGSIASDEGGGRPAGPPPGVRTLSEPPR